METINGYTVIASHPTRNDLRIILAVFRGRNDVEYVTAEARVDRTSEWWWGHYFGGHAPESELFLDAVEDFQKRIANA